MSKGKGRLFLRGETLTDTIGTHSFVVRAPDGYRVSDAYFMPIEDQPVNDVHVVGFIPTVDTVPAVTNGPYFNAVWCRYTQAVALSRGVFYIVFLEPVDGSDVQVDGSGTP